MLKLLPKLTAKRQSYLLGANIIVVINKAMQSKESCFKNFEKGANSNNTHDRKTSKCLRKRKKSAILKNTAAQQILRICKKPLIFVIYI